MPNFNILTTMALTKIFGSTATGITAVNKIDLEIGQGQVFGFLGPNGSGKTTVIGMILGLIRSTSGSIELFGKNTSSNLNSLLRRVGAVLENPSFYTHLSGKDNLKYYSIILGEIEKQSLDNLIKLVGLTDRANSKVNQYSLGMKQRLAVALALLNDPELVILDEPTNGLDPAGIIEFRELIQRLNYEGKTIFLSSHLLHEVEQVCTHVALINKGRILASGPVEDLLSNNKTIQLSVSEPVLAVSILKGLNWIKSVKAEENLVIIEASDDKAAQINRIMMEANIQVFEMRICKSSLETFFLSTVENYTNPTKREAGSV